MTFAENGSYSLQLDGAAFQEEMGRFGNAMGNFLIYYFAEIVMEAMIAAGYADGSETVEQLEAYLDELEGQLDELNANEPEDDGSDAYDEWADQHEELEDIIDEIEDRLEDMRG